MATVFNKRIAWILLAWTFAGTAAALVQRRGYAEKEVADESLFRFARVRFNSYGGGWGMSGWAQDYPDADSNLLRILSSITAIQTTPEAYHIVRLDSPEIMEYPMLYFSEPGSWALTLDERDNLREYLKRGGFAIFDDFEGRRDWINFEACMREVLPERKLTPMTVDHPIFHSFFDIKTLDVEVPATIGMRNPLFYGVLDDQGRVQVIANFNNDIGDFWEWSAEGIYPIPLSNEAFKFGVNYAIYTLTH